MTNQPNRHIAPEIQSIQSVEIMEPKKYTLSNGVPVFVFENKDQDLLKIKLIFNGGSSATTKPWVASSVNSMLTEVTKNYSSERLAEEIDFYGAYFETSTSRDYSAVSLYSLNRFLGNTIPLLAEVVQNASFNKDEFESFITRKKQEYKVNTERVDYIARQRFTALLFGENHPYGKYSKLEDFDNLKQQDLVDFHRKHYKLGSFKIFIAGNFGKEELELLNNHLGLMANENNNSIDNQDWKHYPSSEKNNHIHKDNSVQNAIRMGFVSIHREHPDYFGIKILSTILGGYFGSRLMNNIREDKGYTYGIGSAISSFNKESVFFISTEVNSDVSLQAIEEINKEILLLQTDIIGDNELFTVKNYLQGSFQRSFDGTFNLLDRYIEVELNNLDYSYYQNYIQKVKSIDARELKRLAQKHFKLENIYLLSVGN
jgi:predicted Zn-dependent peptidase